MKKRNAPPKTKGRPQGKGKKALRNKTLSLWVVIAIIVAAGMILSSILIGVDYLTGWRGPGGISEKSWEENLEQERRRLVAESAALKEKIAADGVTVEDLESLANLYGRLYSYALWLEPEAAEEYLDQAAETYRSLLDLEPANIAYRYALFDIFRALGKAEESREQADLIVEALEPLLEAGTATNLERYYYADLQADIYENRAAALEQLELILETEPEDSPYFPQFVNYKEQLEAEETAPPGDAMDEEEAENGEESSEEDAGDAGKEPSS